MANILAKHCVEKDYALTSKALMKLRIFTALALIGFPTFSTVELLDLLDGLNKPLHFIVTTGLLMSFLPLASDRIYNRLSRYKGKLDEREKEAMREAKAFAYKFITLFFIVSIALGLTTLAVLGVDFRTPYITVAAAALVVMNIALMMLFLPITYIAWTQKPLADEF